MSDAAESPARSSEIDLEALAQEYLQAFEARSLETCLEFFDEASVIDFQMGVYKGLKQIETWHKDRFAANLRVLQVESIRADGASVVVDVTASSKRLQAWKVNSIAGRLTVLFDNRIIRHAKLAPRMNNPINSIRSGLGLDG